MHSGHRLGQAISSPTTFQPMLPRGLNRLFLWTWPNLNFAFFLCLSIICILNVNAVVRILFGVPRAASAAIFIFCIASILSARVNLFRSAGSLGIGFFLFMSYFLLVGSLTGLQVDTLWFHFQQYFGTLMVAAAGIAVGWRQAHRPKLDNILFIFYIIWLISVFSIFLSPYLRQYSGGAFGAEYRDSGFFTNPNHAGAVAAITFAIGFSLLRTGRYTLLLWASLCLTALGSLRTFSKMSMLMIITVALVQLALSGTSIKNRLQVFAISVTVLAAMFWLLYFGIELFEWQSGQLQRLHEIRDIIFNQNINDETTTSRTFLMRIGLKKFSEAPFLGQGLGTFHAMPEAMGFGTHNSYLMVAGEAGIFAFALMILFILRWVRWGFKCDYVLLRQLCLNYALVFSLSCLSSHAVLSHRFQNLMIGLTIGLLMGRIDYQQQLNKQTAPSPTQPDLPKGFTDRAKPCRV